MIPQGVRQPAPRASEPTGCSRSRPVWNETLERLKTLMAAIRARGVPRTLLALTSHLLDLNYDARYGTDTGNWVRISDMSFDSINKDRAVDYQPTQRLALLRLFRKLDIPKETVFLDLGSGKGKALLIAAEYGFQTVRGVEFCPQLCRIAEENCQSYRERTGCNATIRTVQSDVTRYEFTDEGVIYLFNPFDEVVLRSVLENLTRSLRASPRRVWIIYRRPLYRDLLLSADGIVQLADYYCWGNDFDVYAAGSGSDRQ